MLVSRSPFDAVLLTAVLTLAAENPRAVSYGEGEKVRHAAITTDPTAATNFDEKKRSICMTRPLMRSRHRAYARFTPTKIQMRSLRYLP